MRVSFRYDPFIPHAPGHCGSLRRRVGAHRDMQRRMQHTHLTRAWLPATYPQLVGVAPRSHRRTFRVEKRFRTGACTCFLHETQVCAHVCA